MSHNLYSVNSITQDVNGYISTGPEYIQIGRGEADPSPSLVMTSGSKWNFYDTAPINRIDGASFTKSGDKISAVTLPAGTYIFWIQCNATGITTVTRTRWKLTINNNVLTTCSGSDWDQYPEQMTQYQYAKLASLTTFSVEVTTTTNNQTSTNDRYTRCSSLTILKVA